MNQNTNQNETRNAQTIVDDLDVQIRALITMAAQAETALRSMNQALTPANGLRDLTAAAEELQQAANSTQGV